MAKKPPTVLVSSTFYDLKQVRDDLRRFIGDELGYRVLLSEHPSFPIDPDVDTVENCRRRVSEDTDILVLLIGGRYGYVDKATAKSITNLEYLTARAKGIPVFAFVDKGVLAVLPLVATNPGMDFDAIGIDDARIFDFINQVRSEDRVWTGEFELAGHVIETLRVQLAYLMNDGLAWLSRVRARTDLQEVLASLSPAALRVALEKPTAWEHRLFGQVLCDAVAAQAEARYAHKRGIVLGLGNHVAPDATVHWLESQMHDLKRIIGSIMRIVNEALPEALGPDGTPGDPGLLGMTGRALGQSYADLIAWCQRVRRTVLDERFAKVAGEMSGFSSDAIEKVEAMGPELLRKIEEALAAPAGDPRRSIKIELNLSVEVGRFAEEMQALAQSLLGSA
jgi:hypothetical protein